MALHKQTQLAEELAHHAANYLARESNKASLITVTRAEFTDDLKNVTVFITVLPTEQEKPALAFAKRSRSDFREYLKTKSALGRIPTVDFEIDFGEKNRQRIDDLTRK
jgi:ribosome-binding factor A